MARTKTVSQNMAFLAGHFPSVSYSGAAQNLLNIISVDHSWSQNKQDVVTYSKLASRDRIAVEAPEIPINISYYLSDGLNEEMLGFNVSEPSQSTFKYILDSTQNDQNYYIFVAPEGADAVGLSGGTSGIGVIGIGNGFINSYSLEASIGDFPTVSVGIQGLNIKTYTGGMNQPIPAVDPITGLEITGVYFTIPTILDNASFGNGVDVPTSPFVIRPGDITLNLSSAGGIFYNYSTADVQSARVSFDMNRQPLNKLGSRFSISREIQYPINVNFEVTMIAKDLVTGSLSDFLCSTGKYNASLSFKYNQCGTGTAQEAFGITLRNISLEGQQWSTQAGSDPQTITTTWVGQIGGSGDLQNGLFMSGWNPMNG